MFEINIGLSEYEKNSKFNTRTAVRGIIMKNGKILMVHTNKGDYKFPGGGVKFGESITNALKREVEEETGYIVKDIREKAGVAFQRNHDKYEKDAIFEMKSIYFFCTVSDSISEQNLDQYEKEQEFEPKWISVEEALKNNISIIKNQNNNPWLEREIEVLKKLNENIIK